MRVPTHLLSLTTRVFFKVWPATHAFLHEWKERAANIPDPELRRQALTSIETKTFHCEGGAIFGLLAGHSYKDAIRFIVAYQTISDYLDNLCDRSTSQDPDDFRALHESMLQALTPEAPATAYYRYRRERNDGGYLASLVQTCREVLNRLPDYGKGAQSVRDLAMLYIDLQVHKHVRKEERLPRLQAWFAEYSKELPPMAWYEFAACTGSTLGIFCIISQLFNPETSVRLVDKIKKAYFPWVQGLHILLDYLIDQEEDRVGADLNFCFYYKNDEELVSRLNHFFTQAQMSVAGLPDTKFHRLIIRGLLSIYLADEKVSRQNSVRPVAQKLLRRGGAQTKFLYWHCRAYRKFQLHQ